MSNARAVAVGGALFHDHAWPREERLMTEQFMKSLMAAAFAVAVACAPNARADPFWHPAPHAAVPVVPNGVHPGVHPVVRNPLWRRPVRAVQQPRFRFRGHTFVVLVAAPLFAAPWLSYPYAVGSQWGHSYYVPG